jgi:hypothetical protein
MSKKRIIGANDYRIIIPSGTPMDPSKVEITKQSND